MTPTDAIEQGAADTLQGGHAEGAAGRKQRLVQSATSSAAYRRFGVDIVRTPTDVDPRIATIRVQLPDCCKLLFERREAEPDLAGRRRRGS